MSDELLRAKPEKYQVNRGIGKPVEFKGLKSQYLFIFCGGLLAVFVVFIVLFMAGVNQWLCIGFIVSASLLLVWQTFRLNACLLYTSPSPRDRQKSRMPSSA